MTLGGLGAAVRGAVTPHHLRGAVAEQVLDIELAGVVGDGPGGARVPEAMGVDARDARGPAEPAQQLFAPGSAACEEKLPHHGSGLSKRRRAIAIAASTWLPRDEGGADGGAGGDDLDRTRPGDGESRVRCSTSLRCPRSGTPRQRAGDDEQGRPHGGPAQTGPAGIAGACLQRSEQEDEGGGDDDGSPARVVPRAAERTDGVLAALLMTRDACCLSREHGWFESGGGRSGGVVTVSGEALGDRWRDDGTAGGDAVVKTIQGQ